MVATTLDDFKTQTKKTEEIKYTPEITKTGTKQYKNMDIKDIAKLLRKDYKQAYPDMKISVRISRYSMGQSIDAQVKEIPKKYLLTWEEVQQYMTEAHYYDDESIKQYKQYYDAGKCKDAFVKEEVYEAIQELHQRYNYKETESYTDYYYKLYYGDCSFNGAVMVD